MTLFCCPIGHAAGTGSILPAPCRGWPRTLARLAAWPLVSGQSASVGSVSRVAGGSFPEETRSALDSEGKHVTIQGPSPDLTSSVTVLTVHCLPEPPVSMGHPSTGIPDTTSMTVEQRSSATVISTSMAPATGPTDPGWAGVPSARIGGASRPFDEDNNNFLVW
jgi:hypothetical protein